MRLCSKCKNEKPATIEFFDRKPGSDDLEHWCKLCCREYWTEFLTSEEYNHIHKTKKLNVKTNNQTRRTSI